MKKCPLCGEEIQDDARKCRYCMEWLSPNEQVIHDNLEQPSDRLEKIPEKNQPSDQENEIPVVASEPKSRKKSSKSALKIVLIIISVISIGVEISISNRYYVDAAEGFPYNLGRLLGGSLLIGTILFCAFRIFKKKAMSWLLCFLLAVPLSALYESARLTISLQRADKVLTNFLDVSGKFIQDKKIEESDLSAPGKKAGEIDDILSQYVRNQQQIQNEFGVAIENERLDTILAEEMIMSKEDLLSSLEKTKRAQMRMVEYISSSKDARNILLEKIRQSDESAEFKSSFLSGFNESTAKADKYMEDWAKIEEMLFDQIDITINFLISRLGKYSIIEDNIYFDSDADVTEFNQHLSTLNIIVQQESDLVDRNQKELQDLYNNLIRMKESLRK